MGESEPTGMDDQALTTNLLAFLPKAWPDRSLAFLTPLTIITGGYEAQTWRFQLTGAPDALAQPLILRLFPPEHNPQKALYEEALQNSLVDQGYPAAKVHFASADPTLLGGGFLIMDLLPGQMMMAAAGSELPTLLGALHAQLHAINVEPLAEALLRQGIDRQRFHWSDRLRWVARDGQAIPWLADGIGWLLDHRPPDPARFVICHGDFHPLNILVHEGKVSGVLDWSGFTLGEAAMDVGFTLTLFTTAAQQLFPDQDWDAAAATYLDAYRAVLPLDTTHLAYYRVLRLITALYEGETGHAMWRIAAVRQHLLDQIFTLTGIYLQPVQ